MRKIPIAAPSLVRAEAVFAETGDTYEIIFSMDPSLTALSTTGASDQRTSVAAGKINGRSRRYHKPKARVWSKRLNAAS